MARMRKGTNGAELLRREMDVTIDGADLCVTFDLEVYGDRDGVYFDLASKEPIEVQAAPATADSNTWRPVAWSALTDAQRQAISHMMQRDAELAQANPADYLPEEDPRERGDDDGVEYGHPSEGRM
jgi:hypothetical protein